MNTVSIELPGNAVSFFGRDQEAGDSILTAAVVKWFELGRISQGKAAELLGLSRLEFLDVLNQLNVSAWQYTAEELDRDIENARKFSLRHQLSDPAHEDRPN